MRTAFVVASVLVLSTAAPARAQDAALGLSVESGVSAPLGAGAAVHVPFALSAIVWLEGEVDGVLRLATGAAATTAGRAADLWTTGTVGLRWSLGVGGVRPLFFGEVGWAVGDGGGDRLAAGLGAGVQVLATRELALEAACALRLAAGGLRLEPTLGATVYF
jgi:hypothetical protein